MKPMLAAITAAIFASTASAHGVWYSTGANTAVDIEEKYPMVRAAYCGPLPVSLRARYGADSYVQGGVRRWNQLHVRDQLVVARRNIVLRRTRERWLY